MYYNTPKVNRYVEGVRKYRTWVLLAYALLAVACLNLLKPDFVSSDEKCWLNGATEYQRTEAKAYTTRYVNYLRIEVERFDEKSREILQNIQMKLDAMPAVEQVDSIFASHYIYNDKDGFSSSLVKALPLDSVSIDKLKEIVTSYPDAYAHFISDDYHTFHYYIYSDESIDITSVDIPFDYEFADSNETLDLGELALYALAMIAIVMLLFRLIFKNFMAAISSIIVISMTTILTFSLIYLITGVARIHIAMSLIVISIALVDFLYFYFRWHVSHCKNDKNRVMLKMINRNLYPAFWTSFITLLGLGTLLVVDSMMIRVLGMSAIFASIIAYLLNLTLLPALLSFCFSKCSKVYFSRLGYLFANAEVHYNVRFLKLFLAATIIVIAMGAYKLFFGSTELFSDEVERATMTVSIPYEDIDGALVEKLETFGKEITNTGIGVVNVKSVATVLKQLDAANSGDEAMDEQDLMQAVFFLELYDLEAELFNENSLNVTLRLENANKTEVVAWLNDYKELQFYFTDMGTLVSSAKTDKKLLLGISLASVLIIIGLIMGRIFRSPEMVLVGFVVNAIPIAWFGLLMELANISLSIEILIAMTITVGLASDATVHFAYKFYRARYFGNTEKHSLQIMFFYAGVPVMIGSLILALVFGLLTLSNVATLQMIGGYGALLIIFSLITDLLVLPVLLLAIDKFGGEKYLFRRLF